MTMRGHRGSPGGGGLSGHGIPEHSELPLRDYDHLPTQAVAQRIRSLDRDEVRQVLDYEWAHACRPALTQVMVARLRELDAGATPSGGTGQEGPDRPESAQGRPQAGQASPERTAPPSSPPPHGVPSQPARPKGDRQAP